MTEPFNMESPPLYRFVIVKLSETEHIFAHVWHHLIMDGIGFNLFHSKLVEKYNHPFSKLRPDELSMQSIALEEKKYWMSDRKKKDEKYWGDFSSIKRSLIQPISPPVESDTTWRKSFHLDSITWGRLVNLSEVMNCTVQHLVLLVIQICFADSRGKSSITVGRPTHRRYSRLLKEKVGHFAGLSLLHIESNPDSTFINAVGYLKTLLKKIFGTKNFQLAG
ncbi:condensation domain-containing protein [Vibrio sp. ZSDZ65]|uniref:Condensation domain-containing protein n=2 Tax=Vibrio qingdaonensis TaxID=2829491 RepID=A0A9X3CR04_9VIBR|nr:condensation domain-containing protein [Vibrio qingdaonensis]